MEMKKREGLFLTGPPYLETHSRRDRRGSPSRRMKDLLRFFSNSGIVDDWKSPLIALLLYDSKGVYEDQF